MVVGAMLPLMQLKSYKLLPTAYDGKWKRGKYQDWGVYFPSMPPATLERVLCFCGVG